MNSLLKLMNKAEEFCCLGKIESDEITKAEQSLGLSFAEEYKEYTQAFGAAAFDGHELTGICKSKRLFVVPVTERARITYPNFPTNAYVIEELLIDHVLVIQDSSGTVLSYGPTDSGKVIAQSLQEYLFP